MRRIIERIVTTVTTTTWKISWETDTPHASRNHQADPISNDLSDPDVLSETAQSLQPDLTVTEIKEVDLTDQESDHPADELPQESYLYPSKIERK